MRTFTEQEFKAIRIANLALLLHFGRELTTTEVARRFHVSRRTAQRDMLSAGKIIPLVQGFKEIDGRERPCWKMFRESDV